MAKPKPAMQALEEATASRQKAAPSRLSDDEREMMRSYLAERTENGEWEKPDREEYIAACGAEFSEPTAAGGKEAAVEYWRWHLGLDLRRDGSINDRIRARIAAEKAEQRKAA